MFITENASQKKWQTLLKEEMGVTDQNKLSWVSEYATVHEIKESQIGVNAQQFMPTADVNGVGPVYSTPLNTLGMGNPYAPNAGVAPMPTQQGFFAQTPGSGDIPTSTLPMALNIALGTIGLELVNVVPAKAPWALLSYMDFPYAGGKLGNPGNETAFDGKGDGTENKPYYIRVMGDYTTEAIEALKENENGDEIEVVGENGTVTGLYRGFSRMDGMLIVEVKSCKKGDDNVSLRTAVSGEVKVGDATITNARPEFVETMSDLMYGFANFHGDEEGNTTTRPMTRAENETGTGNVIGLRLFNKWVQMGAYEVTGSVTRQQLQDLPLYGVDAVAKITEAMQNEITQHINQQIIEHVFRLGVTNAVQQKRYQGVDLNLWIGKAGAPDTKALADFQIKEFVGVDGLDHKADFPAVPNAESNSSAENLHTRQRRIASRILAAADLIMVTGRRGRPDWVVCNSQIAAALQDVSTYVVCPMANNMSQDNSLNSLYQAGTLAGLKVYVDPYMDWNDLRICVGSKKEVGTIFMPYILADTVSITAEGTMAPKMLINSRFAIVDAGFYPEKQYFTFGVHNDWGMI